MWQLRASFVEAMVLKRAQQISTIWGIVLGQLTGQAGGVSGWEEGPPSSSFSSSALIQISWEQNPDLSCFMFNSYAAYLRACLWDWLLREVLIHVQNGYYRLKVLVTTGLHKTKLCPQDHSATYFCLSRSLTSSHWNCLKSILARNT